MFTLICSSANAMFFIYFECQVDLIHLSKYIINSKQKEGMSRRPVNPARRLVGNGGFPLVGAFPSKTRSSPLVSVTLVTLVLFRLFWQ